MTKPLSPRRKTKPKNAANAKPARSRRSSSNEEVAVAVGSCRSSCSNEEVAVAVAVAVAVTKK